MKKLISIRISDRDYVTLKDLAATLQTSQAEIISRALESFKVLVKGQS